MENLENIILTIIVVTMVFMITNLSRRVKKLEEKLEK
jgi:low affinity Fe/Cu permease